MRDILLILFFITEFILLRSFHLAIGFGYVKLWGRRISKLFKLSRNDDAFARE